MAKVNIKRKEVWKKIPNFEGYEISNYGQVRSYWKRSKTGRNKCEVDFLSTPKLMKQRLSSDGYFQISLAGRKTRKVHSLLLLAFKCKKNNNLEARHLDGNKENNTLKNLKWGTHIENMHDLCIHGTHKRKLSNKQVHQIRININKTTQQILSDLYGVSRTHIGNIQNNKRRAK